MTFTPHTITWTTLSGEATTDDNGYPVPGLPGEEIQSPCRYYPTSTKMLKNEDSTEVQQSCKIRFPKGAIIPHQFTSVVVKEGEVELYQGNVKVRNVGQLSGGWVEC